jgi:hypothetical protein
LNWLLFLEISLLVVFIWATAQLALLLMTKQRNERFFAASARIDHAASVTVKEIQQVMAEDFKKARVDHRLKDDTAANLRNTAIKIMLANLGPLGLKEIRKALGLSRRASIDRLLVGRIEAAVYDLKARPLIFDEVPSEPGSRFYPNTLRIPRVEKPEHRSAEPGRSPDENFLDEKTHITGR